MKRKLKLLVLVLLFGCNTYNKRQQYTIEYGEGGKIKSISINCDSLVQRITFNQEHGLIDTIQNFINKDKIGSQLYFNSKGRLYFLENFKRIGKYPIATKWYIFDNELDISPSGSFFVLGERKQSVVKIYYSSIVSGTICKVDSILPQLDALKCGNEDSLRIDYLRLSPSQTSYYNVSNEKDNLLFSPEEDK